ncbi:MAG: FtsH protease activity modulator HflK, partial [Acidobacteria bacterium]|nr:FtsH protease activity modulator HflK [Candidatus Sulfomarinibacter sp. MAG AM2]
MDSDEPRVIDIGNFRPGKPPIKVVLIGVLVLIGLAMAFSVVFTIQPEEVGIVLRFG